jgi:hypothetical protein
MRCDAPPLARPLVLVCLCHARAACAFTFSFAPAMRMPGGVWACRSGASTGRRAVRCGPGCCCCCAAALLLPRWGWRCTPRGGSSCTARHAPRVRGAAAAARGQCPARGPCHLPAAPLAARHVRLPQLPASCCCAAAPHDAVHPSAHSCHASRAPRSAARLVLSSATAPSRGGTDLSPRPLSLSPLPDPLPRVRCPAACSSGSPSRGHRRRSTCSCPSRHAGHGRSRLQSEHEGGSRKSKLALAGSI